MTRTQAGWTPAFMLAVESCRNGASRLSRGDRRPRGTVSLFDCVEVALSDCVEKRVQDLHLIRRADGSVHHTRCTTEHDPKPPCRPRNEIDVHLIELDGHAEDVEFNRPQYQAQRLAPRCGRRRCDLRIATECD